jgi:hypothetical protein
MGMQTDVKSSHLNSSGFGPQFRSRVKSLNIVGTTTAGHVVIWDTNVAPVAMTYGRSGNTVTITQNNHGLTTGQNVGLYFLTGTGGAATDGNYNVTVLNANSYTVQDPNSGTITAGASGYQGEHWITSVETNAQGDVVYMLIPGEGMLVEYGVYATLTNVDNITMFYG